MTERWFAQTGYRCRFEWGRRGARLAAERGDMVVVVDALRFSSAATAAIAHGDTLFPCRHKEETPPNTPLFPKEALSPRYYAARPVGERFALVSSNGATCCRLCEDAPAIYVGAFLNAEATAQAVQKRIERDSLTVSVIACGERWETPAAEEDLRFALEDYLGAGAIFAHLQAEKSPEAEVCEAAYRCVVERLEELLWRCGSGVELRDKGLGEDIPFVSQVNRLPIAVCMCEGWLRAETEEA